MKTRLFVLLMVLCSTISFSYAYDFKYDGLFYDRTSDSTVSIVNPGYDNGITKPSGLITVPEVVYKRRVTGIGVNAFENCTEITSISISNSVTSIGNYAFKGCTGLTSVTIPNSVTSIGDGAFSGCTGLTSVSIPDSVTSIGNGAFSGCTGLTSISIPDSVTSIGDGAFSGCTGLNYIIVDNSNIIYDSRDNCNAIIEIATNKLISGCQSTIIPNNVTSIGNYAFSGCIGLTSVSIPDSVTSIGNGAFSGCTGLTSVSIPDSVTSIGNYAFSGCTGLTSVTIPNSVTSIGYSAFSDCTGLTSVSIPDSITRIRENTFYNCSKLLSVTIPNNVTEIGDKAFGGCTSLTSVVWNAKQYKTIDKYGYAMANSPFYDARRSIVSFTFGNEVNYIPKYLCAEMGKLTSITIPKNVKIIDYNAFAVCTRLTSVVWNAKNCKISQNGGIYLFQDSNKEILSFTFGDEVDSIPSHLCYGMEKLTSVTIPENVTDLGNGTFMHCTNLTDVTLKPCPPPTAGNNIIYAFDGDYKTIIKTIHIPYGTKDYYINAGFDEKVLSISPTLNVSVAIADSAKGTIQIDSLCNEAILTATPSEHCHFIQWSDGNADNPRTMLVTNDTTFTAEFAFDTYNITTLVDSTMGTVSGGGTYEYGTRVKLKAVANDGYKFSHWSNGSGFNPYYFTATEDLTLEAFFIPATAVESVNADKADGVQKVLRDGQVFILRNGTTYNTIGLEVE